MKSPDRRGNLLTGEYKLEQQYHKNPGSKAYQIEVKINSYRDIFNDLDPSPLKKRDLDEQFIAYLDESSADIPLKYPIEICIHCPDRIKKEDMEGRIRLGVKRFYQYNFQKLKEEIKRLLVDALIYLIISIVSLSIFFYLSKKISSNYFGDIIIEGFSIGGWVFLWEALALVAFKSRVQRKEKKRLLRILMSKIEFVYPD